MYFVRRRFVCSLLVFLGSIGLVVAAQAMHASGEPQLGAAPDAHHQFLPVVSDDRPTSSSTPTAISPSQSTVPITPSDIATATNTPTNTPTVTSTVNDTATATLTATPTDTSTNTSTATPTDTSTPTNTPTVTSTATPTDTPTNTSTATPTDTSTATNTPTVTSTATPIDTPTTTSTITPGSLKDGQWVATTDRNTQLIFYIKSSLPQRVYGVIYMVSECGYFHQYERLSIEDNAFSGPYGFYYSLSGTFTSQTTAEGVINLTNSRCGQPGLVHWQAQWSSSITATPTSEGT